MSLRQNKAIADRLRELIPGCKATVMYESNEPTSWVVVIAGGDAFRYPTELIETELEDMDELQEIEHRINYIRGWWHRTEGGRELLHVMV